MDYEANKESKPEFPVPDGPVKSPQLLVWTIVVSQPAPPFMFSGVAVALPAMGIDLNAGAMALGLVETFVLIAVHIGNDPVDQHPSALSRPW